MTMDPLEEREYSEVGRFKFEWEFYPNELGRTLPPDVIALAITDKARIEIEEELRLTRARERSSSRPLPRSAGTVGFKRYFSISFTPRQLLGFVLWWLIFALWIGFMISSVLAWLGWR